MAVRRELQNRSDLVSVDGVGLSGIYLVNAPYASLLEVSEEQIIQEANPWAVFSHVTALAYHRLTDLIPFEGLRDSLSRSFRSMGAPGDYA